MIGARMLLYAHGLVTLMCTGLAAFTLGRRAELDWRFDRQLEVFFADPVAWWAYVTCLLSSFVLPVGVAYKTVGRISAWRWVPVVAAEVVMGLVQQLALLIVLPVRY